MKRLLICIIVLCLVTACTSIDEDVGNNEKSTGFLVQDSTSQTNQYISDYDTTKYRIVMKTGAVSDVSLDLEYYFIKDNIGDRARSFCIYNQDLYVTYPEAKKILVYKDMDEEKENEITYQELYAVRDICIIKDEIYLLTKTFNERMNRATYTIIELDMSGKLTGKIPVPEEHVPQGSEMPDNGYAVIDFNAYDGEMVILYSNGNAYKYKEGLWMSFDEYASIKVNEDGKIVNASDIDWNEASLKSIPYLSIFHIKDGVYYSVGLRNDIIVSPSDGEPYRFYLCSDNQEYNAIPKMKVVFTEDNRIFQSYYDGYYRDYYIFEIISDVTKDYTSHQ